MQEKKSYEAWYFIPIFMGISWYIIQSLIISMERGLIHELIRAIL